MPVYEYECKSCGHEFERQQRISDKPVRKCPSCGALKAKRLISRTSFVLKGGGWYSDLYGTPKAGGGKSSEGSSADSEKSSESKSSGEAKTGSGSSGKGDAGKSKAKKSSQAAA